MYGVIITAMLCATFIWFAHTYLSPYIPPAKEAQLEIDEQAEKETINLDNVVAEIYNRLDEE